MAHPNQAQQTPATVQPQPITRASLPCPRTTRWVPRRKAEVVNAVASGIVTVNEVCAMYRMSMDEFASWARAFDAAGLSGKLPTSAG